MSTIYSDHDFRPAPAGWTVWECRYVPDYGTLFEHTPLAGWLIEAGYDDDGFGGERQTTHRRVVPAVWSTGDGELMSLEDYTASNNVVYLVGPGQDAPAPREAAEALRHKMAQQRATKDTP